MLLNYYLDGRGEQQFFLNGGLATLDSYGISPADTRAGRGLPEDHLEIRCGLPLFHETEDYLFVHAGLRPGVHLADQSSEDLLWIRYEFMDSEVDFGRTVVFGHTPLRDPLIKPNKIGIDTGAVYGGRLTCIELHGRTITRCEAHRLSLPCPATGHRSRPPGGQGSPDTEELQIVPHETHFRHKHNPSDPDGTLWRQRYFYDSSPLFLILACLKGVSRDVGFPVIRSDLSFHQKRRRPIQGGKMLKIKLTLKRKVVALAVLPPCSRSWPYSFWWTGFRPPFPRSRPKNSGTRHAEHRADRRGRLTVSGDGQAPYCSNTNQQRPQGRRRPPQAAQDRGVRTGSDHWEAVNQFSQKIQTVAVPQFPVGELGREERNPVPPRRSSTTSSGSSVGPARSSSG